MPGIYQRLNSAEEFRLLKLHEPSGSRRHFRKKLNLTLTAHSVSADIVYDALSYAWGDPNIKAVVHVNGLPVAVTKNLYDALLQFRASATFSAPIWIDAICINQKDIQERNEQVKLMRTIYSQARKVLVWLGRSLPGTEHLVSLLGELRADQIIEKLSTSPDFHLMLEDLMNRAYWSRLWVLQETVLGVTVIAYCGASSFDFWRFVPLFVELAQSLLWEQVNQKTPDWLVDVNGLIYIYGSAYDCREQQPSVEMLEIVDQLHVTDARDRVYGMLALLPSSFIVRPDYTANLETVYTHATIALLASMNSADGLSWTGCQDLGRIDIPSWMIDFRKVRKSVFYKERWNAGGFCDGERHAQDLTLRVSSGRPELTLKVLEVDHIREVDKADTSYDVSNENVRRFLARRRYMSRSIQATALAFWRAVTGDECGTLYPEHNHVAFDNPDLADRCEKWLDDGYEDEEVQRVVLRIREDLQDLEFFIGDSGSMGILLDRNPQTGDVVVVPLGSRLPLILRPYKQKPGRFQLVGGCCCDGMVVQPRRPPMALLILTTDQAL